MVRRVFPASRVAHAHSTRRRQRTGCGGARAAVDHRHRVVAAASRRVPAAGHPKSRQQHGRDSLVVVVTADATPDAVGRARAAGAELVFAKPCLPDFLFMASARWVAALWPPAVARARRRPMPARVDPARAEPPTLKCPRCARATSGTSDRTEAASPISRSSGTTTSVRAGVGDSAIDVVRGACGESGRPVVCRFQLRGRAARSSDGSRSKLMTKRAGEVTVAREPRVERDVHERRARLLHFLERMTDAQVVPGPVERGAGKTPERAAQVIHRDVERRRELTQL